MRRLLVGTLVAMLAVGVLWGAGVALAASNRTSISLTCDRGVDQAQVWVFLEQAGHAGTGPFHLSCGPVSDSGARSDRTVQLTPFPADAVRVESFLVVTHAGTTDCSGMTHGLTAKVPCADADGHGATLTVR